MSRPGGRATTKPYPLPEGDRKRYSKHGSGLTKQRKEGLGTNNSAIATLVERTSRFTEIVKLDGLTSPEVVDAVSAHMQQIPTAVRLTLTWDQGKEMAQHQRLAKEAGVPIYFCDPKSPWQRGTNENTNGLIRQWFPKRITDLTNHSQADFDQVAAALNDRPRKILGYRTPSEVLTDTTLRR